MWKISKIDKDFKQEMTDLLKEAEKTILRITRKLMEHGNLMDNKV